MSWSHDQVQLLIDEYKKHSCLYAVKHKQYKNKHARMQALEDVEKVLKELRPSTNLNEIKAKFNGLRTNFLAEYRKYMASQHSGMSDDEVYTPTLWYYDSMTFILEHTVPRSSTDTIIALKSHAEPHHDSPEENGEDNDDDDEARTSQSVSDGDFEYVYEGASTSEQSPASSEMEVSDTPSRKYHRPAAQSSQKNKRFKKDNNTLLEVASDNMQQIANMLAQPESSPKTHEDIFGELVASHLKMIARSDRREVERKIMDIIFEHSN